MTKAESGDQREILLLATLPHVMFDGWHWTAVEAGAVDAGFDPADARDAFPEGINEVLDFFSGWADKRMLEELEKHNLEETRVRDRVALAVRTRLEILAPYREAVQRGVSAFAFPANSVIAAKALYRTVDAIWYAAGDTSTDYNFYTKRLLLAGVLSSTTLYWLQDSSEGSEATWSFLDRRIDDVMKIGGTLGKGMKAALDLPDRLFSLRDRAARRRGGFPRRPSGEA